MDQARDPEQETQQQIDERVLDGLGFQVNRQRRNEDGQNDQYRLVHGRRLFGPTHMATLKTRSSTLADDDIALR